MTDEKKPDFTDSEPDPRAPSHIRHARVFEELKEMAKGVTIITAIAPPSPNLSRGRPLPDVMVIDYPNDLARKKRRYQPPRLIPREG